MSSWGVIGGGMLGMTLAARLRQAGHQVTLIEGAPHLGGLAAAWQLGDIVWDKHYHVILRSDRQLLPVIDELGLTDDLRWVETRTGCYSDGTLYSVSNTIEYLKFPVLSIVDKARLGWTLLLASRIKDYRKLERLTAEEWLTRHSGRRAFERFWKPLLRSKLGENYRIASASFIWAILRRLYGARESGMKKEMFGYVRGGYARILERFAEYLGELGVETRLATPVSSIRREGGSVRVQAGDDELTFESVVVTMAPGITTRVVEGLGDAERERMNAITYQGIICASFLMDRPLGGFYVTNIIDDWVPFTGVIEMSTIVDPSELGGKTLVYLPRYTTQDDPAIEWSDEEVEDRFLTALEKMYPEFERSQVQAFQISRVRYVLPVTTLRYSDMVSPFQTSVQGVYSVNSSHIINGTLNVNETLQLVERAMPVLLGSGTGKSLETEVTG
ncbi:MAG TPA: NAD(P)/FAD-dependent oxidoreductase [Acidimicrobiia bacterium]